MKVPFAFCEVQTFELKTPAGPQQVRVYRKTGSVNKEVPDKFGAELIASGLFNRDLSIEGTGMVMVRDVYSNTTMPQPISFMFPPEIKSVAEAFERFDEFLKKETQDIQAEEERRQNSIRMASAGDLAAIDAINKKSPGGLILP